MKKMLFLLLPLFVILSIKGQVNVDSLINVLEAEELTAEKKYVIYDALCQKLVQDDYKAAIAYAQKGLELAIKEKDKLKTSLFYDHLGRAYNTKQNFDSALIYFDKALALAQEGNDSRRETDVYISMGVMYAMQSDYLNSIEHFVKALAIAEKNKDKKKSMTISGNIGSAYFGVKNFDRSLYYFEKSKEYADELNDVGGKVLPYTYLSYIYKEKNDVEKTLEYGHKALEYSRATGALYLQIGTLEVLALVYREMVKDYDQAFIYAKESLELAEKTQNPRNICSALTTLSNVYLSQEKYQEANDAAMKAWETDSTSKIIRPNITHNIALSNVYLGDTNKAATYITNLYDLVSQYAKEDSHKALMDLEVKYETEKKEMQIMALEKEKHFYTWMGVLVVLIVILGSGVLFYRIRLNKQRITQLEQEKQLVATQALLDGETAERSRLSRDLHDGLGGLLSILKLNLSEIKNTSFSGEEEEHYTKATDALEESIEELRRIAHHMMPESLMRTGLKTSLSDFSRAIPGVSFQYQGKDARLDERLEITLYRCTYELIHNAVKHSGATQIDVQLLVEEHFVSLSVLDNGRGFNPQEVTEGTGLDNIRTRIATFNGTIHIDSSDQGTEVTIEIELL